MIGTFKDSELTFGSFGQQYATIDGQRFITWFDVREPRLKGLAPGCSVEYEARPAPTELCHSPCVEEPLPSATLLRVVHEPGISTPHPKPSPPAPRPCDGRGWLRALPARGGEGEPRGA